MEQYSTSVDNYCSCQFSWYVANNSSILQYCHGMLPTFLSCTIITVLSSVCVHAVPAVACFFGNLDFDHMVASTLISRSVRSLCACQTRGLGTRLACLLTRSGSSTSIGRRGSRCECSVLKERRRLEEQRPYSTHVSI